MYINNGVECKVKTINQETWPGCRPGWEES